MARSIGVGGLVMWPVALALGALVACGGGSLGNDGRAGAGGQDGGGAAGGGAAGNSGAAGTSGGGSGAGGGGGAAGITGTFGCGPYTCARGSDYCAIQEPSTSTQTAEYGCEPLPSGCSGATDCACLCPNGSCPRFPFVLTYLCFCSGSSGSLTVDCNGE